MADFVTIKVEGLDRLSRRLKRISVDMKTKVIRAAARKAMNIVRDAARAKAQQFDDPETPEKIWRLITTQESRRRARGFEGVVMRVGVRGGARSSKERIPPWYWRLKEFGTEKMEAEPFMRPSLTENADKVLSTVVNETNKALDQLSR
jgi:HK97 gp10 family phage protein